MNKENKGHIFFIMWLSGSWKSTLIKWLKDRNIDLYIPLSYKTREPRHFERNWVDAFFVSVEDFKKSIENNEFLEYAIVYWRDYYWTKFNDIIDNWVKKWKIVLKEVDILGLKRMMKEHPEFREFYTTIFLNIPVEKLRERINKRWEEISEEDIKAREQSAIMEEQEARKYCDYMLDATQEPEKVLQEVLDIIK